MSLIPRKPRLVMGKSVDELKAILEARKWERRLDRSSPNWIGNWTTNYPYHLPDRQELR